MTYNIIIHLFISIILASIAWFSFSLNKYLSISLLSISLFMVLSATGLILLYDLLALYMQYKDFMTPGVQLQQ